MDFVCFFHENEKLVLENRIQTKANRELRQWNLIMMSPKRKKRKKKKRKSYLLRYLHHFMHALKMV